MREQLARILKIVCIGLAVLLLVQLVKAGFRANPLVGVTLPDVPSLPADTNAPAATANKGPNKPGTNAPNLAISSNRPGTVVVGTNVASTNITGTNIVAHHKTKPTDSNAAPITVAVAKSGETNVNNLPTNAVVATTSETNTALPPKTKHKETNALPVTLVAESPGTNQLPTNVSATVSADTNVPMTKVASATNAEGKDINKTNSTNSAIAKASGAKRPPGGPSPQMMAGMMMGGPGGAKAAKLPPEIQARVDRVTESEILAPVNHPMPMALLGIAGKIAFLRSPSGQTGMVKEGEDLGEIKLLRIGINRVLVEQDGQPKELVIFAGLGGESLLPKPTVTSDETTKN
jgi:hypothetical protein